MRRLQSNQRVHKQITAYRKLLKRLYAQWLELDDDREPDSTRSRLTRLQPDSAEDERFDWLESGDSVESQESVLMRLFESGSTNKKIEIIRRLGNIGSSEAIQMLRKIVMDISQERDLRMRAVPVLQEIGSPEAIQALIEALIETLKDSDKYVRQSAVYALEDIGSQEAIPALIEALQDSSDYVRRSAAEALGEIGSQEAIPALIETLKDSDKYVRLSAAKALGEIGSQEAIPALQRILNNSEDSNIQNSANIALRKILRR